MNIFDINVLDHICKEINDPKTYFNFAQVCKKSAKIATLHRYEKMDEFSIMKTEIDDSGEDCYVNVSRRLPNGNLHGKQYNSCSYAHIGDSSTYYFNGTMVGYAFWDEGVHCWITHYNCKCYSLKDMKDYVYKNINLYNFVIDKQTALKKCINKVCNKCNSEYYFIKERWINIEHKNRKMKRCRIVKLT